MLESNEAIQTQMIDLLERIASLEIDSEKYNSDVVGCYLPRFNDEGVSIKFLQNGVGYVDNWENLLWPPTVFTPIQIFTWEKEDESQIKMFFGDILKLTLYSEMGSYYLEGEKLISIEYLEIDEIIYKVISGLTFTLDGENFIPEDFIDCQYLYPDS